MNPKWMKASNGDLKKRQQLSVANKALNDIIKFDNRWPKLTARKALLLIKRLDKESK